MTKPRVLLEAYLSPLLFFKCAHIYVFFNVKSHVSFFICLGDERVHKLAVYFVEHVNRFLHIVLQLFCISY